MERKVKQNKNQNKTLITLGPKKSNASSTSLLELRYTLVALMQAIIGHLSTPSVE
jgi:hypothetical protein